MQPSVVQTLPSLQSASDLQQLAMGELWHLFATQVFFVQGLPSSQEASLVQHDGTPDPWHTPLEQASPVVQALPSSQALPLATGVCEHAPLVQLSVVQTLPSLQSATLVQHDGSLEPLHDPLEQASFVVHTFPSLHGVPLGMDLHVPLLQS